MTLLDEIELELWRFRESKKIRPELIEEAKEHAIIIRDLVESEEK